MKVLLFDLVVKKLRKIRGTMHKRPLAVCESESVRVPKAMRDKLDVTSSPYLLTKRRAELVFSASLGRTERKVVHQIAEYYGLVHTSIGRGDRRQLRLNKLTKEQVERRTWCILQ